MKDEWKIVKFGEIAREIRLTTQTPIEDGLEFYIGLEHLDPQSLRIQRKGIIAEDNPSFTRAFKAGQILFGKRRSYQKKAAVADFDGICSGDIIVMEAVPGKIIPGLLPFIIQSDMFFDWAIKTSSGSLSPRTKWNALAEFEFPLPPIERQEEITEVFNKIQHTLYSVIKMQKISSLLLTSIISDHIGKIQKAGACLMPLSSLGDWKGGGTPPKNNKNFWTGGSIPWVSPKDMSTGKLSSTIDKITNNAIQKSATNLLPADSILFVTRSGILRHTLPIAIIDVPMTFNQDIKALSVKEHFNPYYIWIILQFYAPKILQDCSKVGTTVESIDFNLLKKFELSIPERNLQDQIVEVWQNQMNLFNTLKQKEQFMKSISTQVFSEFLKGGVI